MGGEGSIMHMIVSYRNNTALIRKKRLMKGGRSYFLAKKAYRKAAGGEAAFRTATPEERATIKAKIRRESRRDSVALILIFIIGLSLAIFLTIKLWPYNSHNPDQYLYSVAVTNSEMSDYEFYIFEGDISMANEKFYSAVFYYEQAFLVPFKEYQRFSGTPLKTIYIEQLEGVDSKDILTHIDYLISRFPNRIELYRLRAELFKRRNMPMKAKADYQTIEALTSHF